jgi:predicted DNA-binding ribbon-helix-helix protein
MFVASDWRFVFVRFAVSFSEIRYRWPIVHLNDFDQRNMVLKAKRNIQLVNVRTSVVLETAIWDAVGEILLRENLDLNGFCQMVDKRRRGFNLTSAIRVVVVIYYRTLAHEQQQFSGATPSLSQLNAPDPELPPISLLPIVLKSFRKGL